MSFDPRSGYCLTSGPPAPAAPFAPQMCFQTAYVPTNSVGNNSFSWGALSCTKNGNTVGACSYDTECGPGSLCDSGRCWPSAEAHKPQSYDMGNPRVVGDLSWDQVRDMMTQMGLRSQFDQVVKNVAFGKTMFLVEHRGQSFIATPLNAIFQRQEPNCSTCLKSVWQCDRFRDQAKHDPDAKKTYEACLQMQSCFLFDTMNPKGVVIPIMMKMDPVSIQAATAALQKCSMHCGDCQPSDPLARGSTALFH